MFTIKCYLVCTLSSLHVSPYTILDSVAVEGFQWGEQETLVFRCHLACKPFQVLDLEMNVPSLNPCCPRSFTFGGSFHLLLHIEVMCLYVFAPFLDIKLCENELFTDSFWYAAKCLEPRRCSITLFE